MLDIFGYLGRLGHQFGSFRVTLDQGILFGVQLDVGRDLAGRFIAQLSLDSSERTLAGALTPCLVNVIGDPSQSWIAIAGPV
jgi:hypothetical protein